jgi:hypothetical protein
LLKSGISSTLFNDFVSSYQSYKSLKQTSQSPFVFVGEQGEVKLVTDFVNNEEDEEIFAVSVAEDGWMEFLAFSMS